MATLVQARHAQRLALAQLAGRAELAAVGITGRGEDYSLTVDLQRPARVSLPSEIDGVALRYEYVGGIHPAI